MLKITTFLLAFITFSLTAQQKVLNGITAEENQFPWMCTLELDGFTACGATVIDQEWVLTAAHCAWVNDPFNPEISVLINPYIQSDPKDYSELIQAERIYFFGNSGNPETLAYGDFQDLALIKLAVPTTYDPIKIAQPSDTSFYFKDNFPANLIGWGLDETSMPRDTLQYGQPKLFSKDSCDYYYSLLPNAFSPPNDWEICAGYRAGEEAQGAAAGDSGGPLFVTNDKNEYMQVGIVSRGDGGPATTAEGPGIFTHVAVFYDWIQEIMSGGATSISDQSIANSLRIRKYQNQYEVQLHDIESTFVQLEIINISGHKIKKTVNRNNTQPNVINIDDLQQGFYFLHIKTDKGMYTIKFWK